MPADSGHGHKLLPVAGSGRGCGHKILVAGADMQRYYPRGFCPLPSLVLDSAWIR